MKSQISNGSELPPLATKPEVSMRSSERPAAQAAIAGALEQASELCQPEPVRFVLEWPEPEARFLRNDLPPPPNLPFGEVLGPRLAQWVMQAAEPKGAPADYVLAALLAVTGSTIGNSRWVSPRKGWAEPPIIWTVCIGLPSSGKSPAIDAVLAPLRIAEMPLRQEAEAKMAEWSEKEEASKLILQVWSKQARTAIEAGEPPPPKPDDIENGPMPFSPRLVVNDATIEKLGFIVSNQPRGTLQMRDVLSGWLEGMTRYSGGRGFTVERMGRAPLTIDSLSIGVLGGIQPDRLKTLLFKSDDDGLLARFLPIWPNPAPVKRPLAWGNQTLIESTLRRLLSLSMTTDDTGNSRPWFMHFSEDARTLMDDFRLAARAWESEADGLKLSFTGKLPGLAARLSLVLAFLDWGRMMPKSHLKSPRSPSSGRHICWKATFCPWTDALMPMHQRHSLNGPRGDW